MHPRWIRHIKDFRHAQRFPCIPVVASEIIDIVIDVVQIVSESAVQLPAIRRFVELPLVEFWNSYFGHSIKGVSIGIDYAVP